MYILKYNNGNEVRDYNSYDNERNNNISRGNFKLYKLKELLKVLIIDYNIELKNNYLINNSIIEKILIPEKNNYLEIILNNSYTEDSIRFKQGEKYELNIIY